MVVGVQDLCSLRYKQTRSEQKIDSLFAICGRPQHWQRINFPSASKGPSNKFIVAKKCRYFQNLSLVIISGAFRCPSLMILTNTTFQRAEFIRMLYKLEILTIAIAAVAAVTTAKTTLALSPNQWDCSIFSNGQTEIVRHAIRSTWDRNVFNKTFRNFHSVKLHSSKWLKNRNMMLNGTKEECGKRVSEAHGLVNVILQFYRTGYDTQKVE